MKIESSVLDVLGNAATSGNGLVLKGELDRTMYVKVDKVLTLAGGKWNRKAKAHLFESDASDIIDSLILTGEITDKKKEFDQFFSPKPVVARALELAEIENGMLAMEPSAGHGAIAIPMTEITPRVDCVELEPINADILRRHGLNVVQADFMELPPEVMYDRIVMNPPFSKQQDIKHVLHAYKFLKPGGVLVSVMSAGVEFRTNRLTTEFRDLVKSTGGVIERLPEGSFLESGTGIHTAIAVLHKED